MHFSNCHFCCFSLPVGRGPNSPVHTGALTHEPNKLLSYRSARYSADTCGIIRNRLLPYRQCAFQEFLSGETISDLPLAVHAGIEPAYIFRDREATTPSSLMHQSSDTTTGYPVLSKKEFTSWALLTRTSLIIIQGAHMTTRTTKMGIIIQSLIATNSLSLDIM